MHGIVWNSGLGIQEHSDIGEAVTMPSYLSQTQVFSSSLRSTCLSGCRAWCMAYTDGV